MVRAQVLGSFGAPAVSLPTTARAETGPAKVCMDSPKKVGAPKSSPQKTAKQQSAEKSSPLKMAAKKLEPVRKRPACKRPAGAMQAMQKKPAAQVQVCKRPSLADVSLGKVVGEDTQEKMEDVSMSQATTLRLGDPFPATQPSPDSKKHEKDQDNSQEGGEEEQDEEADDEEVDGDTDDKANENEADDQDTEDKKDNKKTDRKSKPGAMKKPADKGKGRATKNPLVSATTHKKGWVVESRSIDYREHYFQDG